MCSFINGPLLAAAAVAIESVKSVKLKIIQVPFVLASQRKDVFKNHSAACCAGFATEGCF